MEFCDEKVTRMVFRKLVKDLGFKDQNNLKNVGYVGSNSFTIGASGETRTRTSLRTADFESAASTIPPPRHWEDIILVDLAAFRQRIKTMLRARYLMVF